MKVFYILFISILLFSCSSLYSELNVSEIQEIKISTYTHYYESNAISEVYIKDKGEFSKFLFPLRLLPPSGDSSVEFHEFLTPKIVVEFYYQDSSQSIFIVNNRIEPDKYSVYKRETIWEKSFVKRVNSF